MVNKYPDLSPKFIFLYPAYNLRNNEISATIGLNQLKSLNKNILYFKSPTDIKTSQDIDFTKKIRVGGMVKKDSVIISEEEIKFIITCQKNQF